MGKGAGPYDIKQNSTDLTAKYVGAGVAPRNSGTSLRSFEHICLLPLRTLLTNMIHYLL